MKKRYIGLILMQICFFAAGAFWGSISTGIARPEWVWSIGNPVDNQLKYYSVAYKDGWLVGAYSPNDGQGEAVVSFSLDAQTGQAGKWWAPGEWESVSGFVGGLVLTEAGTYPTVFKAPAGGGQLEPIFRGDREDMYAFAGLGAQETGLVLFGSRRDKGGWVSDLNGSRLTSEMRDADGTPIFGWDATRYENKLVVGATLGLDRYNEPAAGRLCLWDGSGWTVKASNIGGILEVTTLEYDPGALWMTTAWGEVVRTVDLDGFEVKFQAERGHDVRLIETGGHLVAWSAAGVLYEDWQEVARIPGVEYLALAEGPDGVLGGTAIIDGVTRWVRAERR